MIQKFFEKYGVDVIAVVIFILASCSYFYPALKGQIVFASDNVNGRAAAQESIAYMDETGDCTFWSGSMFSGMPNYQIGGNRFLSDTLLNPFVRFFHWGLRNAVFIFLFYLVAFFILLRAFDVDKWISIAGAFAIAMSSYFFIIIAAQHHGKTVSITYMTLVLVGFVLTFRKRYGWGAIFTMFFMAIGFQLHPQMSYYICMLIGMLFCAELYIHIKEKRFKDLAVATAIFASAFLIGFATTTARTFANTEYAAETMRGGHSDLVKESDAENKTKGLDLDYATAWSYGIDESLTFLIPNYMGGASGYNAGVDSEFYRQLVANGVPRRDAKRYSEGMPAYWGDQPFTAGPVYMGAIVCFLFILGLLIVKGPYKWALLAATVFSILLAWGKNFMPLTELFFNWFPMYNKFRAVSSILIVAEITMPLLGFMSFRVIADPQSNKDWIRKAILIAAGITGGVCLIIALFAGSLFDFTSAGDEQFISNVPDWFYKAVRDERQSMLEFDAWRSLLFVLLGAAVSFVYSYGKFESRFAGIALTALVVADMWGVDKRFCNEDNFVDVRKRDREYAEQPYEKQILQDKDLSYRVFNLTNNPFNDARTSYRLKSVGGYSAAKLRRYQDLIDEHISKFNFNVLNMLNTRYFVVNGRDGKIGVERNPDALGNAWFIDSLIVVGNANEESDALNHINTATTAVTDSSFASYASAFVPMDDEAAHIELTGYKPNRLEYKSSANQRGTVVFSEIYYPHGWKAYVDGAESDIFRVNYVLRAMNIPEGEHEIVFEFNPESVRKGNMLSGIAIGLMYAIILALAGYGIYHLRRSKA